MDHRPSHDPTMHPRHPGRGSSTSLIAAEGDEPEVGGFFVFLPSGATKQVAWRRLRPIQPTLDAAKDFTIKVVESLQREGLLDDIDRTNWASVVAAVQRIILDWNDRIQVRIGEKMAQELRKGSDPHFPGAMPRRVH